MPPRSLAMAVISVMFLAGAVGAAAPSPSAPPSTPSSPPTSSGEVVWLPRYDFTLEVDGKLSPEACFYQERDSSRLLVNAPELPKVCILNQQGKQVIAVERSRVKMEADGDAARLLPGAEAGATATSYSVDAASVVFYVGRSRLKILPKLALIGPTDIDDILRHSPLYKKGIAAYVPESSEIAFLKSYKTPIQVEVYFGTWCSHCKVLVPKFVKSVNAAANPNLKVSFHGVPTSFGTYEPAKAKKVQGIPTFIFWKEGREVGRIPGEPAHGTIEHAVAEILRSVPR